MSRVAVSTFSKHSQAVLRNHQRTGIAVLHLLIVRLCIPRWIDLKDLIVLRTSFYTPLLSYSTLCAVRKGETPSMESLLRLLTREGAILDRERVEGPFRPQTSI